MATDCSTGRRPIPLLRLLAAAALVLAVSKPAAAEPLTIGAFSFIDDILFGPVFQVENLSHLVASELGIPSGVTFEDVVVDVETDGGPFSFSIGPIAPGGSAQTAQPDLLGLTILSGTLLLVTNPLLTTSVDALVAPADGESNPITTTVTAVPEPGTLLLLGGGLATAALARRRRRRRH
ncbi:MAG TPA: PEP-CTERM sorting domain-containing protein [Vicinamibacterales bacterium]|nr:PEP-CTERM sorting domain-containing protein [Vicinamibacterales bacterium]